MSSVTSAPSALHSAPRSLIPASPKRNYDLAGQDLRKSPAGVSPPAEGPVFFRAAANPGKLRLRDAASPAAAFPAAGNSALPPEACGLPCNGFPVSSENSGADHAARLPPSGTCRIQDMPAEDRPREKMLRRGPASLSDAELLALFFRTGTRDLSAIDIGRVLLKKYGSLTALSRRTVLEIQKQKGLGPAKALDLAAAFELGKRLARQEASRIALTEPEAVCAVIGPELRAERQEVLKVLLLTARCTLISIEEIARGSVSQITAHPREILRPVFAHSAHAFVLAHNHPSGDPSPSPDDMLLTRRLRDACGLLEVKFFDHIIIGAGSPAYPDGFHSFRKMGIL